VILCYAFFFRLNLPPMRVARTDSSAIKPNNDIVSAASERSSFSTT